MKNHLKIERDAAFTVATEARARARELISKVDDDKLRRSLMHALDAYADAQFDRGALEPHIEPLTAEQVKQAREEADLKPNELFWPTITEEFQKAILNNIRHTDRFSGRLPESGVVLEFTVPSCYVIGGDANGFQRRTASDEYAVAFDTASLEDHSSEPALLNHIQQLDRNHEVFDLRIQVIDIRERPHNQYWALQGPLLSGLYSQYRKKEGDVVTAYGIGTDAEAAAWKKAADAHYAGKSEHTIAAVPAEALPEGLDLIRLGDFENEPNFSGVFYPDEEEDDEAPLSNPDDEDEEP